MAGLSSLDPFAEEAKTVRIVLVLVAIAAGIAVLSWLGYKAFIAPINAKHDIAAAKGQQAISDAGAESAKQAGQIVAGNGEKAQKTDETTRTNYVYITKQPGAADPVNPAVWGAFERSVCLRVSAAGLPECQRLREPDPEGVDAWHR